ncbi:hypothetical protein Pcinc_028116 [Petrolisthes cinctipes]|uniref:Uncharacterized protein n=1 Tax=Petrolisthes cinctipes TaxID=88211 RepID=A0AAE1K9E0_PETCI|nr:hypothetical protein Pcinc_028116 [Petrolisthes cinctipes]
MAPLLHLHVTSLLPSLPVPTFMSPPPYLPSLPNAAIYTARYCSQVIALTSSPQINNTPNSHHLILPVSCLYVASDMASTRCVMVMLVLVCGLLSITLAMPSPTPDPEAEASNSRYYSRDRYGYNNHQDNHHHHDDDDDGHYHLTINKHGVSGYYHEHDPRLHTSDGRHHYQSSSSQYQPYRRSQGYGHHGQTYG